MKQPFLTTLGFKPYPCLFTNKMKKASDEMKFSKTDHAHGAWHVVSTRYVVIVVTAIVTTTHLVP